MKLLFYLFLSMMTNIRNARCTFLMFDSQKYLSYLSFSPLLSATCFNSFCPRPTLPFFHFSLPFSHFSPFILILQSFLVSLSPFLAISPVLIIQSLALSPFPSSLLFLLLYYSLIYSFIPFHHVFIPFHH